MYKLSEIIITSMCFGPHSINVFLCSLCSTHFHQGEL